MNELRLSLQLRERPTSPPACRFEGAGRVFFIGLCSVILALLLATMAGAQTASRRRDEREPNSQRLESRRPGSPKGGQGKKSEPGKSDKKKDEGQEAGPASDREGLFLPESPETQVWLPDIWRCPECGYEQDEPGTCPDHADTELVKVLAQGNNPLAPAELDGNEDLVVDIPLTGLVLRKTSGTTATGTAIPPTGTASPGQPPRR